VKNEHFSRHSREYLRVRWIVLCCASLAGFALVGVGPARAQTNSGITARFPEPHQVVAAYPDEVERFVALRIVNITLNRTTTGRTPGAYDKGTAYVRALQQISVKYDIEQPNSKAAKEFSEGVRKLGADQRFRQSVLERFRLTDLATEPRPVEPSPFPTASKPPEDVEATQANRVLFPCGPIWLATLVLMGFVPRIIWNITGQLGNSKTPSGGIRLDSGQLPDSLREFRLLGFDYRAGVQSGKVIEEKTWSETYVNSVTTPATFQVVGDQVYQSGGGTTTSSSTVTKDRIWVRTPNGGEAAWTFSGGKFVARQGQVLSGITQPSGDGSHFLIVFNHTTGQSETYRPISTGQKKIHIMLAWIITTLLGAAGFVFGTALLFMPGASVTSLFSPAGMLTFMVILVRGGFVCLIGAAITARLIIGYVRGKIEGERGFRFNKEFKPLYMRFLQESTPVIVQSLANV